MFFRKKPDQVGKELLALVKELSDKPGNFDDFVHRAEKTIPNYILRQADENKDKAIELLATSLPTIEIASDTVIQYIYSRSIYNAAQAQGLSGFLVKEAGKHACASLTLFGFDGIKSKNYERVLWAAKGLVQIGDSIQDYYFQTLGLSLQGIALHALNVEALARSALSNGLARLPYAETQEANNETRLKTLHQLGDLARQLLNNLSD